MNKAFSLIELMIVIGIIGILATIAIPHYERYVVRSKISEVISLAKMDIQQMDEYFDLNGYPANTTNLASLNAAVNFAAVSSSIVSAESILRDGLEITISGGDLPTGLNIRLRYFATGNPGSRVWSCAYGAATSNTSDTTVTNADYGYLPSNCHQIITSIGTWY